MDNAFDVRLTVAEFSEIARVGSDAGLPWAAALAFKATFKAAVPGSGSETALGRSVQRLDRMAVAYTAARQEEDGAAGGGAAGGGATAGCAAATLEEEERGAFSQFLGRLFLSRQAWTVASQSQGLPQAQQMHLWREALRLLDEGVGFLPHAERYVRPSKLFNEFGSKLFIQ